jgi:hypothetical protein
MEPSGRRTEYQISSKRQYGSDRHIPAQQRDQHARKNEKPLRK